MDNPQKMETLGTQDTGQRQTEKKKKTHRKIKKMRNTDPTNNRV